MITLHFHQQYWLSGGQVPKTTLQLTSNPESVHEGTTLCGQQYPQLPCPNEEINKMK